MGEKKGDQKVNIGIIGVGGVGGYFGGKLAQAFQGDDRYNIYFIARGTHLAKIKEQGLILKTHQEGELRCIPTLATEEISQLPPLDICLICVKSYDLQQVLLALKPKLKATCHILPLLNGVDIYDRIRKVVFQGNVYPACVYVGTHILEPGVIEQTGGTCKIILGKDPQKEDEATLLKEVLKKANITFEWTKEYWEEIWSKYMFIASYGLITTIYNKTIGGVYKDPELSEQVKYLMQYIKELALLEGIHLKETSIEESYHKASTFPYETKTSFQRDYEKGTGRDEREIFGATLLRLGKKHGLSVVGIEKIYNQLV
ncbi:2-dehydropantoate 2-reductase [Sporanaerobium hydrogeniformans]|uniref:2-dehydropantoate 2-reductase n=1 Tax=Sporanaerobium hydrogeniformans TaxID=3072179 RepID=A0AC61DED4_9FIRM|nr:2-dehydropantoate 2-reductase [Sporanaerobium hydrogeniformans]PHV71081.1 2-dehydropantoate 2-reductase [Sporanaerobium hydrogeniformans]